jgi:predicted DNA-binding transcriptional regulator AlpA
MVMPDTGSTTRLLRGSEIWSTSTKRGELPISRATWMKGIKEGRYPKGRRISARLRAWTAEEIDAIKRDGIASRKAETAA